MPIYEFYCLENHRIYQFYARTLAQGAAVPRCPDNPKYTLRKLLSGFAVGSSGRNGAADGAAGPGDEGMEATVGEMEREFSGIDESDPRAMGRMMRRLAQLTGEKLGGDMEEVVRKLEEGADPESLAERLGDDTSDLPGAGAAEVRRRLRARRVAPVRDPKLYEFT